MTTSSNSTRSRSNRTRDRRCSPLRSRSRSPTKSCPRRPPNSRSRRRRPHHSRSSVYTESRPSRPHHSRSRSPPRMSATKPRYKKCTPVVVVTNRVRTDTTAVITRVVQLFPDLDPNVIYLALVGASCKDAAGNTIVFDTFTTALGIACMRKGVRYLDVLFSKSTPENEARVCLARASIAQKLCIQLDA